MNYREIFENALSEVCEKAPFSDDDKLFDIVKERTRTMKKTSTKWKKPTAVTAAALSAAAVVTVSAGAALNWDFNSAFGSIFRSRTAGLPEERAVTFVEKENRLEPVNTAVNDTYTAAGFDYTRYGKELDLSCGGEGFTVDFKGMINDGWVLYVMYDITFEDSAAAAHKEGFTDWDAHIIYDTADGAGRGMDNRLISVSGNTYSYYGELYAEEDISGKTLTLDCRGLWRESIGTEKRSDDEIDREYLSCDFSAELPIDTRTDIPRRIKEYGDVITVYDFVSDENGGYAFVPAEIVLNDLIVTPFTCTGHIAGGRKFDKGDGYTYDPLIFTFSDDTTLTHTWTNGTLKDDLFFFQFEKPVEPDDIVSVAIGDTVINF